MAIEVTDEQICKALLLLSSNVRAAKEEQSKRTIAEMAGKTELAEKHHRLALMHGDMAFGAREVLKVLGLLDEEA